MPVRGHRNTALASMLVAGMALAVRPQEVVEKSADSPAPEPIPEKPKSLPGETNRQFAARMKVESK